MRKLRWAVVDVILINVALFFSLYILSVASASYKSFLGVACNIAPFVTLISILVFWAFGLYKVLWRYATTNDLVSIVLGNIVALGGVFGFVSIMGWFGLKNHFRLPTLIFMLECFFAIGLTGGVRMFYRMIVTKEIPVLRPGRQVKMNRALIIGAGYSGATVVHGMVRGHYGLVRPVVIVDDDLKRTGSSLHGVSVIPMPHHLKKITDKFSVDEIVIAIATPQGDYAKLVEDCLATGCKVKRVSIVQNVSENSHTNITLKDIDINDLLGRKENKMDMQQVSDYIHDKTVLITGGGGSIGSELCRILLSLNPLPKQIVLYDISENYMYDLYSEMRLRYGNEVIVPRLFLRVGTVRDERSLSKVFDEYKPEIVLHAAAHKHVPLMEDSPFEAIKNNVFGTYNTARVAMAHGVERFLLISTDKAVNPTNVMGTTKRMAEMILTSLNGLSKTEFTAVRFGNVLGSHGSVVPLFMSQINAGGPITLTHPDIIRFFMTIPEAASLVLQTMTMAQKGELYILDMGEPVKIRNLAERMIQLYSKDKPVEIAYTGLRPGEKLYEELLLPKEGAGKTDNNQIFIAKAGSFTREHIDEMCEQLAKAISLGDEANLRKIMKKYVPTYHDPNEVNKVCELA